MKAKDEFPNFAACCAEGGGFIGGCSCENKNHIYLKSVENCEKVKSDEDKRI